MAVGGRGRLVTNCHKAHFRHEDGTKTVQFVPEDVGMCRSAPRIAWPLVSAIPALDAPGLPIADVWRRLGAYVDALELPRPSYEQTRVLVHRSRAIRALPGVADLALDVAFRTRGPAEAADVGWRRLAERSAAQKTVANERSWRPSAAPGARRPS